MKKELRKVFRSKRRAISDKKQKDFEISKRLICSDIYLNASTILFYAALEDEINIDDCISKALACGKRVALPRCINDSGDMEFYFINSLDDLESGYFGVREPDTKKCSIVTDFTDTLCIVPALAYDKNGYRLGYGKGFYDKFLQKINCISIGLCYNELIVDELPINQFDIPVNYIITEDSFITV